ncbi:MAG TPA: urea carboxylase, partial [Moraxellaceae bacterium]|nr:urea carboxylase [Moraxellaceae bacterium]
IHDNAYAIGAIDFTGDMPIILGPDGPSLGGFVCPAVIVSSELWKVGQLKAGDTISFIPVSYDTAKIMAEKYAAKIQAVGIDKVNYECKFTAEPATLNSPILATQHTNNQYLKVVYRPAGNNYLLVEYGEQVLDLNLRFRVHA